ncbi:MULTISPECIES: response regulator [unclassified Butyrivibrio]|jgi:CheY-like chemotaxis protein|uniref:response regulator n=1 Tax=unclassified Butyrivibrio TaxID=2639466 RepID=UPI0003B532A4|nr:MULTISPECIES: response regulator [unclassified Butyrivibrio]MDC7293856.1 response regulator [Butyrivibrio sp. DSM 10294]
MKKKILLVRNEETFLVNAIKNALLSNRFEVTDSSYALSELAIKKNDADLIVLYTDQDFEEHKDAMVYFKDLCIEENMIMLIIGDKDAFDLVHKFVPKEDIAFEVTRPLDMADLINKVATATDEEFELARRKSILIVDDDPTYIQMIREWLKDTYRVGMANSGTQAVAWLATNKADLILLDYDMPVLDGPKVMEMLRSESFSSSTPVMFLTGKNDRDSVTNVISLKPADYLLKTISKDKLLQTLDVFFKSKNKAY